jgi:hypothetical protein
MPLLEGAVGLLEHDSRICSGQVPGVRNGARVVDDLIMAFTLALQVLIEHRLEPPNGVIDMQYGDHELLPRKSNDCNIYDTMCSSPIQPAGGATRELGLTVSEKYDRDAGG